MKMGEESNIATENNVEPQGVLFTKSIKDLVHC